MKITYKETSINIKADAFSSITNEIRFSIESELSDGALLNELFPYQFRLSEGKLVYGSTLGVPNMYDLMTNVFQIEQSDVGKFLKPASDVWATKMLYNMNLLNINLEDWTITE